MSSPAVRRVRPCALRALAAAAIAAAALLLIAGCQHRSTSGERGLRPNVVLIVVDALRADRLQCYGYERATSPNLDALAADGTLFADAMAQSPETVGSVPSLLTGRRPGEHNRAWVRDGDQVLTRTGADLPTLAEMLREHGYATAAVSASPLVGPDIGADQGFDSFHRPPAGTAVWQLGSGAEVTIRAREWLDRRRPNGKPFLLYLHYLDPHNQYRPPSEFCVFGRPGYGPRDDVINAQMNDVFDPQVDRRVSDEALAAHGLSRADVERLSDLYDGEVLCVDHAIGQLLGDLRGRGLYENTMVIVTADHGEAFLEHDGLEHGGSLYQELLHVPLIVRVPGLPGGRRVRDPVEVVDVMPTILDAVGMEGSTRLPGRSLYPTLARDAKMVDALGFAELPSRRMYAVRMGRWKLITSPDGVELYDLHEDPRETTDLHAARPDEVKRLSAALRDELAGRAAPRDAAEPASRRELEALRALGYIK